MDKRMATSQDSLFSLELVVEKLYLPYVTCRFPAVAFRLLDFPTILICHVEKELADVIKTKVDRDPYYRVPNQFADLQDKQGNFMVKKGKSCLFKISLDTLSMHLSNTPLYIMVLDEFPEVPKLLGNSSLALNEVIDAVKCDVKKNGPTVPSVQGDKGLFKIYSLMGKEIGYMILGFRLLSLGPGLIAHLPAKTLVKRASERQKHEVKQSVIDEIMEIKEEQITQAVAKPSQSRQQTHSKQENLNNTREMGSMTDAEKCDALMQTIDIDEEKVHIAVSSANTKKDCKSIETQTERRVRRDPKQTEDIQVLEKEEESDDDILINPGINCPPPLFYNSKAEPDVHIDRDVNAFSGYSSTFDDATLEDLSGDEHFDKVEPNLINKPKAGHIPVSNIVKEEPKLKDARTVVISSIKQSNIQTQPTFGPGLNLEALKSSEPIFPLLTALLNELSKIQNPQFVDEAMQQVAAVKTKVDSVKKPAPVLRSKSEENVYDVEEVAENESKVSLKKRGRKAKTRATETEAVPKNKGWIRKAPEVGVKKTKLVFGLTNTQRLRLAKQNPSWLKSAEQDEKASKALKQQHKMLKTKEQDFEDDAGNLSDTYTEVRRLAAEELAKTTLGRSQVVADESKIKKAKKKKGSKSRESSPAKGKPRTRSQSPKKTKESLKGTVQVREESDQESPVKEEAVDLDPDSRDIASPEMNPGDKLDSQADSIPSSRIEVRIPSATACESDEHEDTFSDSFEDETPSDKKNKYRFPGFNQGDVSLPDSIAHDGKSSMNTTVDDDSPLESTRVSKQFKPEVQTGESLFKSTEDYDTKQFHSTDEPELQKLMSGDEKSDTLPTPATDCSVRSQSPALTASNTARLSMKFEVLNPKASQQSPLPAVRRSQQLRVDSINARPSPTDTPRSRTSLGMSARPTPTDTPRSRSSQSSPKQPTPRPRRQMKERRLEFKKESIHTESVSSYVPSESENILSLISDGSYSDDFHPSSEKDDSSKISIPELPRFIPSTKLGFTIS